MFTNTTARNMISCDWSGGLLLLVTKVFYFTCTWLNKANLRDLIAANGLVISNWIQIVNFSAHVTVKFDGWPRKTTLYTISILRQALCIISNPLVNSNWIYSPETLNSGRNWWYVIPCDLEIWWMALENDRAPLLCYFKLLVAFSSHWWIQTGVTVRKRPIWVKFEDF